MGLIEKAITWTTNWGYNRGLKDIKNQIQEIINQKRLVFLGDNHVLFTDKLGKKQSYTLDEMVKVAIEVGGWQKQMDTLGITEQDVKNILIQEYVK